MLKTIEAYLFAFREVKEKPKLWFSIIIGFIISGSIGQALSDDMAIIKAALSIAEFIFYIGIANIAVKVVTNKEYTIRDIFISPSILWRCVLILILMVILSTLASLPVSLILIYLGAKNITGGILVSGSAAITMAIMIYVFMKLYFSSYYLLDKKLGVWQCLKVSWEDNTYKVCFSIFLALIWITVLSAPLLLLDRYLNGIHLAYLLTPIQELAMVRLYMQLQQKRNNDAPEQLQSQ